MACCSLGCCKHNHAPTVWLAGVRALAPPLQQANNVTLGSRARLSAAMAPRRSRCLFAERLQPFMYPVDAPWCALDSLTWRIGSLKASAAAFSAPRTYAPPAAAAPCTYMQTKVAHHDRTAIIPLSVPQDNAVLQAENSASLFHLAGR